MTDITARFEQARDLFEHAGRVVYFNSASYGPFCNPVRDAIRENLDLRAAADRDDSHDAFETADQLRGDFADLIGAEKKQVGIGLNTSFGLNIAAFGLPLQNGDEVLISDIEFPAVVYTWQSAAETRGLTIRKIKSRDGFFDVDTLVSEIGPKTRVLSLSYVQFFNGFKNDLELIAEICQKHKIFFIVDGIQGMGVEPLDVRRLGIDVFTSGCQKWMLSPQGCGFFYLSDEVRDRIKPPFMTWLGVDWEMNFSDLFYWNKPYFDSARRFEMGYYAVLNILGMKAALKIFQNLGIENIQQHNHALIDRLAEYVRGNPFYRITCSMEPKHRSCIFTFTCDRVAELHRTLLKSKIVLVNREGSIRVSVHLFNNEQDVDRMMAVLDEFAKKQK